MDCRSARLLLDFDRPQLQGTRPELEGDEVEALRTHLADCDACRSLAQDERAADDALSRAVKAVPVPDGLRDRLLARLSAERDAWWRRVLLRSAGVAAAVFLAVWGAMLWRSYHLP